MKEDVWLTGIGVISSIGHSKEAFWNHALAGTSGAVRLDWPLLALNQCNSQIGAPIRGFDPIAHQIDPRDVSLLDRCSQYALAAAQQAVADAGFEIVDLNPRKRLKGIKDMDPYRLAVAIGSGIGGLTTNVDALITWHTEHRRAACNRYALPMLIPNAPAAQVAIKLQARGEARVATTACAAGTMSIGDGFRLIRDGEADVVLCGGAESLLDDPNIFGMMGFDLLKTMSKRNEAPEKASRPFDKDRDGFVLSEGAGVVVLERAGFAQARGARAYAKILSYASNCDAHSMMQIDGEGEAIERMMQKALQQAGLGLNDVDYINAHGTSTHLNDKVESLVFRRLFGSHMDSLPVSSTKSMTGHAIAASGALEAIATALTIKHDIIPPTINLETLDPECNIDCVPNQARPTRVEVAMSNSYGFGGHNACLVMGKV